MSSKESKRKARVRIRTRRDALSTRIRTLDSSAAWLGVDEQGNEKCRQGRKLKREFFTQEEKGGKEKHVLEAAALEAAS